jgi:hypothetical protein
MAYSLIDVEPPDKERMEQLTEFMKSQVPDEIAIVSG